MPNGFPCGYPSLGLSHPHQWIHPPAFGVAGHMYSWERSFTVFANWAAITAFEVALFLTGPFTSVDTSPRIWYNRIHAFMGYGRGLLEPSMELTLTSVQQLRSRGFSMLGCHK
ncbi:hypothetical protein BDQ17DRAFT_1427150 [Cyathus striatus]|nr:hypothetical protein BDQ17DRAFT_1427150 [Cyathus striatus]